MEVQLVVPEDKTELVVSTPLGKVLVQVPKDRSAGEAFAVKVEEESNSLVGEKLDGELFRSDNDPVPTDVFPDANSVFDNADVVAASEEDAFVDFLRPLSELTLRPIGSYRLKVPLKGLGPLVHDFELSWSGNAAGAFLQVVNMLDDGETVTKKNLRLSLVLGFFAGSSKKDGTLLAVFYLEQSPENARTWVGKICDAGHNTLGYTRLIPDGVSFTKIQLFDKENFITHEGDYHSVPGCGGASGNGLMLLDINQQNQVISMRPHGGSCLGPPKQQKITLNNRLPSALKANALALCLMTVAATLPREAKK